MTLKSFNVWVIYQINTHLMLSLFSHPVEFKRDLSEV